MHIICYHTGYMKEQITDGSTICQSDNTEAISCAWNPEDGITLEWWGRAEGLEDKQ